MEDFDHAYILSKEHRPELSNNFLNVDENPVIDLLESSQEELIAKIGKACKEWGFFQVINHGVPSNIMIKVTNESKKIFELSLDKKKKVQRDELNATGYHDAEHTKNTKDWKEVFDYPIHDALLFLQVPSSHEPQDMELWTLKNQWPQSLPHFRETMEEYGRELEKLSYKLSELISLSLGLYSHKFNECFKNDQLNLVRLNRYPPCPCPELALGVGPHVDSNVLTVLAQDDIGGLQVMRKSTGDWIGVEPISSAFVVNLGEIFQVWSNDKYEAVEHRVVVNSKKERFSFPFFLTTSHHTMVKPAEELVSEKDPAKYKTFNVGKYHAYITGGDFNKQEVESNRINYFKISD